MFYRFCEHVEFFCADLNRGLLWNRVQVLSCENKFPQLTSAQIISFAIAALFPTSSTFARKSFFPCFSSSRGRRRLFPEEKDGPAGARDSAAKSQVTERSNGTAWTLMYSDVVCRQVRVHGRTHLYNTMIHAYANSVHSMLCQVNYKERMSFSQKAQKIVAIIITSCTLHKIN